MSIPLILNDQSYLQWSGPRHEGVQCIYELGEALNRLSKLRKKSFLLSDVRIGEIALGADKLVSFLSEGAIRDQVRVLLSYSNRSPYGSFSELDAEGVECFCGGISSKGILYASMLQTIAISFSTHTAWGGPFINAQLRELVESSQRCEIVESDVDVRNISSHQHIDRHVDFLSEYRAQSFEAGRDVWAARSDSFPSLIFLRDVERQLDGFIGGGLAFEQMVNRLHELDAATSSWNPVAQPFPVWRSKVTPEGERRKNLCKFLDDAGAEHTYDLHARFTPGAGRVHFRLIPALAKIEIAYIGVKL